MNKFEKKGVTLAVIGCGQAPDLKPFAEATKYEGILLTDPGRKSFQTLKFKDNVIDLIGLKSFTAGFTALMGGHKPGALKGSPLQLGGAAIVTPDNRVTYYFQSKFAGDHPSIAELLDAVSEL